MSEAFHIRHDVQARCVYAHVAGAQVKTSREILGGGVISDLDAEGRPVGLRILYDDANDFVEKFDAAPDEAWPPGLLRALIERLTVLVMVEMQEAAR